MSVERSSNLTSKTRQALLFLAAAHFPSLVFGYPDGAPWGAANPAAHENCGSCHFGTDPVMESEHLSVEGLPAQVEEGRKYDFVLSLTDPEMAVGGFQFVIDTSTGESGTLNSTDGELEFAGSAIRSVEPRSSELGEVRWTFSWLAPRNVVDPIYVYAAASAANNDQSPFGDIIHYRSFVLPVRTPEK